MSKGALLTLGVPEEEGSGHSWGIFTSHMTLGLQVPSRILLGPHCGTGALKALESGLLITAWLMLKCGVRGQEPRTQRQEGRVLIVLLPQASCETRDPHHLFSFLLSEESQ